MSSAPSKIHKSVLAIGGWYWLMGYGGALWVVLSWVSSHFYPISQYGWAGDILSGILFASFMMASGGAILYGLSLSKFGASKPSEHADYVKTKVQLKFVRTILRLRFSGETECPQIVYAENILDWFIYWSASVKINEGASENTMFFQPTSWALFVNFKEPSDHHQIVVNFSGDRPITCEVKRNFPTSTVVTMTGLMAACEMEVMNVLQPSPSE